MVVNAALGLLQDKPLLARHGREAGTRYGASALLRALAGRR